MRSTFEVPQSTDAAALSGSATLPCNEVRQLTDVDALNRGARLLSHALHQPTDAAAPRGSATP